MIFEWVTIGDQSVCDDCQDRDGRQQTMAEWEAEGLPRDGATICGDRCRCSLIPTSYLDADEQIPSEWENKTVGEIRDEVFEDIIGRIHFDKRYGKALLISNFRDVVGIGEITYQQASRLSAKFDRMLELIYAYEEKKGRLPKAYYDINGITKKMQWLESQLKDELGD